MIQHPNMRPVTLADAIYVARNMRGDDVRECWAASHVCPTWAVLGGIKRSSASWTLVSPRGLSMAILGVSRVGQGMSAIWLLGTPEIEHVGYRFTRDSVKMADQIGVHYGTLINAVHARNVTHIRWLKLLGFKFAPGVHAGPDNELFIPFMR